MTERQPSLNVNRPLGVLEPEKENAYPIPLSDWSFIKEKVDKIEQPKVLYNTIGAVLLGISGSALLAALGLLKAPNTISVGIHVFCWVLFVSFLLIGVVVLYFDNATRGKYNIGTKKNVLEEMDRLENRFKAEVRVTDSSTDVDLPALPVKGHYQTDKVPAFLVGTWIRKYFDQQTNTLKSEITWIDDTGNYYVGDSKDPKFKLKKFNLEWSKNIVTFDKRDAITDMTHSRERLYILENGLILFGEVKGKRDEKRHYKKIA